MIRRGWNLSPYQAFGALYSRGLIKRNVWAGERAGQNKRGVGGGENKAMSKREIGTSPALGRRIAQLRARMQDAEISEHEMKTFHKVAAIMGPGDGS